MKKTSAIILVLSILFLCACTNGSSGTETTAAVSSATTATEEKVIITEWGTDLIPEDFPAPPEGTYNFEIAQGNHETDESDYDSDWVRIRFSCPTQNLYTLTNAMLENGYIGGSRSVTDGTYYRSGLHGYWQNGTYIVRIFSSSVSNFTDTTVTMDIVPCIKGLPDELLEFFPDFNGCNVGSGYYCGHDAALEFITSEYKGSYSPNWHWEFLCANGLANGFIGVSQEEFDEYCDLLEEAKFSGPITTDTVDGFNVVMVDAVKEINGTTYGVYILYNISFQTLEFAFTNNPALITDKE